MPIILLLELMKIWCTTHADLEKKREKVGTFSTLWTLGEHKRGKKGYNFLHIVKH